MRSNFQLYALLTWFKEIQITNPDKLVWRAGKVMGYCCGLSVYKGDKPTGDVLRSM